ncbi:MAG: hypothetical protein LBB48_00310 [Treponema sp.]|jgi:hypothetical protein|nr:hypothetical protein [Treponema sp.]
MPSKNGKRIFAAPFRVPEGVMRRGETALYGLRLPNEFENNAVDSFEAMAPGIDAKMALGHGLEVKIAAGYRS